MFINYSNHPSAGWCRKQLNATRQYGPITDIPFPDITSEMTEADLDRMAAQ